jgi:nucleobase:cation symporter-1, NCS1 family
VGYSSLLGPVGGIMIVDYYFIRNKNLDLNALYTEGSIYSYKNGFNSAAIIALLIGIVPNVFGFLKAINVVNANTFPDWLTQLYSYAWFVGFGVSALIYWFLMKHQTSK